MKSIKNFTRNPLIVSLLFGCLFWIVDGLVEHYYFRDFIKFLIIEGPETPAESILFKVSPHGLFVRISVLIASGIGGLLMWFYLTRLKASKKELKKFKTISDNSSSGTIILSIDAEILYINKAYAGMHDRSPEELKGKSFYSIFTKEQKPRIKALIQKSIDKGSFSAEKVLDIKKDGTEFPTIINATLIKDGNQTPLFLSGTAIDLSRQENIEKKNKRLEQKLQQVQKIEAIGTLAGGIAHDFNNILFPIVGYTEMLLEDVPKDSPLRDSLNNIYTSSLRAKDLVQQILTFSRQESSELKLMKMQPIIKEALKLIRSTIPTTIEIKQDINPGCGVIKANPTQIHQIVMNLATNAYHAMEKMGGKLKVGLKQIEFETHDLINPDMKPGSYACLTIADTGKGMNKAIIQKIFDPFFTTKEKGKGTGMGLSVVHGIVIAMGGAIQVYSEPEKGTEFHVYFPIEENSSGGQPTHSKTQIRGGTEQILIVDDEEAILTMEKRILERLGYHVTSHTSSLEALESFRTNPDKFDLIITDMAMPNLPGDKLSAELCKIRPDIPILLCTGFSETMSEKKAVFLGIKGFLSKPVIMKDLAQKIREVLDKTIILE
jgi:PAS domain S-box-containing protein